MPETLPAKKSPFKSKTLWVNALVAVAAFFGAEYAEQFNAANVAMILGVVNMVLRAVTKKPIFDE